MQGEDVRQLQLFLISRGYLQYSATGYFGSLTQAAVQAFQRASNIVSSGTPSTTGYGSVGPKTNAVIASQGSSSNNAITSVGTQTQSQSQQTQAPASQSCVLSGTTIASGQSVTAYQSSSVAAGQTCQQQTRTCTNGTLSGTYTNASCSVQAASIPAASATATITADSTDITVGQSTVIHARFTAGTNDAISCTDITNTPGGAGLIGPCTPYNKDYTFTPTQVGTYTFNAEATTATYSNAYHVFGSVTVNVGAATAPQTTATITADSTNITVGQSTTIHARFVAGSNDALLCSDITKVAGGSGLIGPCTPYNKDYIFTPTQVGTYTFNAEARTTTYPTTYHVFGSVTVTVGTSAGEVVTTWTDSTNISAGESVTLHAHYNLPSKNFTTDLSVPGGSGGMWSVGAGQPCCDRTWTFTAPYPGAYKFTFSVLGGALYPSWTDVGSYTVNVAGSQYSPPAPTNLSCSPKTVAGPIVADHDGQTIENVSIYANGTDGIRVQSHSNVRIRNVTIHHVNGRGINVLYSPGTTIQNVDIINDGISGGPTAPGVDSTSLNDRNIECSSSPDLTITNARLTNGTAGISLTGCNDFHAQYIEGHNSRIFSERMADGGRLGGSFFGTNNVVGGLLEDFSIENDPAMAEAIGGVWLYGSSNIRVRRGLIDGINLTATEENPSDGSGGIILDTDASSIAIEDVDAIHMVNGCFGVYGALNSNRNVSIWNANCRDTYAFGKTPDGTITGTFPVAYSFYPSSDKSTIAVNGSKYYNLKYGGYESPNGLVSHPDGLGGFGVVEQNFTPRLPQRAQYCI